ncbi:major facilitator superfamily domain-containing protein [Exophiala viscosa]|uniref:Major facilitator superfamily domain-containing protein n=1 Tax=Exophiala viscosa TaxID=2486360 RepID=A0AAN6IDJ4_9EURO|nr:major facilitator superfamily domain-containing protein [Exophiala viscosa]
MGLGVLESRHREHVPGTVFLHEAGRVDLEFSLETSEEPGQQSEALKHIGSLVLIPQPSASPNDPLNWSKWKKLLFLIAFAYGCGVAGADGPILSAAAVQLATEFEVGLPKFISSYNGVLLGCVAVSSFLGNSLAVKYGKRPVYLVASILLIAGSFWGGGAKSLGSLTGSRALVGLGVGPWEALIPASIADVWFVHQRGFRLGIFNLGIFGGISLAPPITGPIIEKYGWRNCMYGVGGAHILQLILTFLLMPETAYHRSAHLSLDTAEKSDVDGSTKITGANQPEGVEHTEKITSPAVATGPASLEYAPSTAILPTMRELLPWSGYNHHVSLVSLTTRPIRLIFSPIVFWCTILFTTCVAWLVLIAVTISQIFSGPPYKFGVEQVGATNLSSFVASVIGALVAHRLSDGLAVWMAKKNHGIYEPEFRLPLVLSYLVFSAVGFFVWGQSVYAAEPWAVPVIIGLGLINLGVQLTTTAVAAYLVDAHRQISGEAFALLGFISKVFCMGLTFYITEWLVDSGIRNAFFTLGGITAGLGLSSVPMYIWGKRVRSWEYRHEVGFHL